MANLNFPINPTNGQIHTVSGKSWQWNGVAWRVLRVGTDGKSAYDLAIENGFVGTEAQWIASLKGTKGDQGIQGETGETGPRGEKGDTGADGTNGKDGTNGTNGQGVPVGGTQGQVLTKNSSTTYDVSWQTPDYLSDYTVPLGGTQGQFLGKTSGADGAFAWLDLPDTAPYDPELPLGGNTGQVLTKKSTASGDVIWADNPTAAGLPDGGTAGQIIIKNSEFNGDATWQDAPNNFPEAPQDGKQYARSNGAWVEVVATGEGGSGGTGVAFEPISAVGTGTTQTIALPAGVTQDYEIDVFVNGLHLELDEYAVTNGSLFVQTNAAGDSIEVRAAGGSGTSSGGGSFPEAPQDGKMYARQDGAWVEVTSGTGDGSGDPYYRMAGFFTTSPAVNEILIIYVVDQAITFPANFTGSQARLIGVQPGANFVMSIRKNSTTEIGTLSVNTAGVASFATTDGTSKTLVAGDAISIHAPGVSDAISNLTWILRGNK